MTTSVQLNMRWVLLAILVLALTASGSADSQQPTQASSEISGTVRRVSTRRPIQTATVRLLDAGDESAIASTMTGDDGVFRFGRLRLRGHPATGMSYVFCPLPPCSDRPSRCKLPFY